MPRNPKYFEENQVYFISSRTEEGLPFRANAEMSEVYHSILARAQELYPVNIIAHTLFLNQLHMLLSPKKEEGDDAPQKLALFVGYVKQELAHWANLKQARRKKTIWCEGYDSPVLLTEREVLRYMAYVLLQAASAFRVSSAAHYESLSSYRASLQGGTESKSYRRLSRQGEFTATATSTLRVEPYCWREVLCPETTKEADLIETLKATLQEKEELLEEEAKIRGKKVKSFHHLSHCYLDPQYRPTKFGKRMLCISSDKELRKRYIAAFKALRQRSREVWAEWKSGNTSVPWPRGMFPPSLPYKKALTGLLAH